MNTPLTAAAQTAALLSRDATTIVPVPAPTGSNVAPFRAAAVAEAKRLGEEFAAGNASLTQLAFFFSAGVRSGELSEGDADALYAAFVGGHNDALTLYPTGHEAIASDAKSLKVPTSIFKTFGKRSAVAMGADFYARVIKVRHAVGAADRAGSAYNAMVTCNRRVVELGEKSATVVVSDDDIRRWITKKPVVSKDELAKLEELVVKIAKLAIANPVALAGLTEPTSELERFVARCKLMQNRPAATLEVMSERETVAAEAKEEGGAE